MHPEHPRRCSAIMEAITSWSKADAFHIIERTDAVEKDMTFKGGVRPWKTKGDNYYTAYTTNLLARAKDMIRQAADRILIDYHLVHNMTFVFVRPPGHHATADGTAAGFCHQNNAWIAVEHLKSRGLNRIAIFDWDAHHGDGTEDCLMASGYTDVRFCSTHAFGPHVYPGTGAAFENQQILNLPLAVGTDAAAYETVFQERVLPFLKGGHPEVILISAGYDAHEDDPMGLLKLKDSTYRMMSESLKALGVPVLFLLEGGYQPDVLARCVRETLDVWI
jgi:acetoin utilization deacetylase AcuC-like enzyme